MRGVHLDVGQERGVVAGPKPAEMAPQGRVEICVVGPHRRLGRQYARLLVLVGQPARGELARLDVRLVERMDVEDRAGHGGRELPAEELGTEIVRVVYHDPDQRLARALERLDAEILLRVGRRGQPQVDEEAVDAVDLGGAEGLAIDRDEALSLLAGGLGQELLEPGAEGVDRGRGDERGLVASVLGEHAHHDPEHGAGILFHRDTRRAGARHLGRAADEARDVETHHRRGHHPEVGERRVAPADRRLAEEDASEAVGLGDPLHLRARVGDRDEAAPDLRGTDGRLRPLEEVLLEDVRLERRARLGRDDEERPREIHGRLERPDLRGIGRVEDVELGPAGDATEGQLENFGAEARAAHSEQDDVAEARLPDVFGGAAEFVETAELLIHDPEPAEPPRLVPPGPQRRVPRPEPAHLPAIRPVL